MEIARNIALVFLGGGLGASVRYGLTVGLGYAGVSSYIVLVGINLTGSLLIGLLVGLGLREGWGCGGSCWRSGYWAGSPR